MIISAMKQAIDVLEILPEHGGNAFTRAADALRQAIAEAEKQEPVAWWDGKESVVFAHNRIYTPNWTDYFTKPLYADPTPCKTCEALARAVMMDQTSHDTAPTKREWVGDVTDQALIEEVRRRGFTIRDAQVSPKREWVSIPDWEIHEMYNEPRSDAEMIAFAREFEAKLKEKNHG